MNKFIGLDNFTLKQKEILHSTNGIIRMPDKSGKTSACITILTSFCRGNNNVKACLVTKDYNEINKIIEDINTLDTVEIDKDDNRCIIKFSDTNSTMIICNYNNKSVYLTDGTKVEYGDDLYFKYTLMYFDGVSPMDIYLKNNDMHPIYDKQREAVINYLSCCVTERVVFVCEN